MRASGEGLERRLKRWCACSPTRYRIAQHSSCPGDVFGNGKNTVCQGGSRPRKKTTLHSLQPKGLSARWRLRTSAAHHCSAFPLVQSMLGGSIKPKSGPSRASMSVTPQRACISDLATLIAPFPMQVGCTCSCECQSLSLIDSLLAAHASRHLLRHSCLATLIPCAKSSHSRSKERCQAHPYRYDSLPRSKSRHIVSLTCMPRTPWTFPPRRWVQKQPKRGYSGWRLPMASEWTLHCVAFPVPPS